MAYRSSGLAAARGLWFQVHKWIGILLAVLIVPVSLSGSALVWHDWLDGALNPQRQASGAPALAPSAYAAAAATALAPGERILSIRYPEKEGAVTVVAARPPRPGAGGRPVRTNLWLHPADARLLDRAAGNEGAVRFLHVLHGSLQIPGFGRQVVGWIGVAMLLSALSGLWLWWPARGRWSRGLRWRRQGTKTANLHHQAGFWVLLPLAMLSFTGAWISFPSFFGKLSGEARPAAAAPAPQPRPLARPALGPDAALAAALPHATGPLASIAWPTDRAPEWKIAFARAGGAAEVEVGDSDRAVTPPKPPRPETLARTMRRLHDGTGMGAVWQVAIFVGGLIPALLAVTGITMWWRSRTWRAQAARRRRGALEPAAAAAE